MGERVRINDVMSAYEKNADLLFRISLGILGNEHDAQDAVQETFIRYMRHVLKFSSFEHEKAWLIRVTENICLDMLRHKKIRNYTPIEEIHSLEDAAETNNETDVFEKLSKLPSKFKTVIILHHLEGYSVEETSKILGISLSATKMRLKRGREALRNSLEKEDYDV